MDYYLPSSYSNFQLMFSVETVSYHERKRKVVIVPGDKHRETAKHDRLY